MRNWSRNWNGPALWTFTSSILFDCHNSAANGATSTSFDGERQLRVTMIGFVDDGTECINTKDPSIAVDELTNRMNQDAQKWNDLPWASRGDLERAKCLCHMTECFFDEKGRPMLWPGKFGPEIRMQPSDGTTATDNSNLIEQRSAYELHRTLGHLKSLCGSQKPPIKTKEKKKQKKKQ